LRQILRLDELFQAEAGRLVGYRFGPVRREATVGLGDRTFVIGASGVMNTSLMSYFERIREFGVLRSVGWTRWRVLALVLSEALVLSLIGAAIGVGLGVMLGRTRWLELTLNPFIIATQVIPKVALLPLFVVWFGFGNTSKVIVAAILAFFTILTNTVLGVKSIDSGHSDVMTSLNATRWQVFRRLELPSALPYILTGMEIGIVLAIIGAIVGEYLGGNAGLGFMLVSKMNGYETDGLFAVIVQMTLLGFFFYFLTGALRRLLIPWHQSVHIR
jgi:NitT/TauT family transport system permease protein